MSIVYEGRMTGRRYVLAAPAKVGDELPCPCGDCVNAMTCRSCGIAVRVVTAKEELIQVRCSGCGNTATLYRVLEVPA
jgi:aspartate carbamoyltransferase regulatory subunit